MFVLDTNTLIYFFKNEGDVANNLLAQPPEIIFIPTVVVYELEVGIAKSTSPNKRRKQLRQLLNDVTVLPFGLAEARTAAQIRASLEQLGTPIGHYDTLIAATALTQNAQLVTRNVNEFGRIPTLQLTNWF